MTLKRKTFFSLAPLIVNNAPEAQATENPDEISLKTVPVDDK